MAGAHAGKGTCLRIFNNFDFLGREAVEFIDELVNLFLVSVDFGGLVGSFGVVGGGFWESVWELVLPLVVGVTFV